MTTAIPPGWPRDLPPPQTDEFGQRVVGWLLDRVPGGWRSHPVLRRHPLALAALARHHLDGELTGLRQAYSAARRELADVVPPGELESILAALEAQAATVTETQHEVRLIAEALQGKRWRPRL